MALALAEILTRLLVPDPGLRFENDIDLFAADPLVGYRNAAHFHGWAQGFVAVDTNALGMRGPDFRPDKPVGTYRIVGLGDSVTWGVGVADADTYLRRLERGLASEPGHGQHTRTEVLNAGVVGYSLHQELLFLRHHVMPLGPDLVFVGFALNDAYPTEDPFYNVAAFHEPARPGVRRRTYPSTASDLSAFYRFARTLARRLRDRMVVALSGTSGRDDLAFVWKPGSFEAQSWPVLQGHFLAMRDLTQQANVRMVVLLFPTLEQLLSGRSAPTGGIAAFLAAHAIEHLDLAGSLRPLAEAAFSDSMHLTPDGHAAVAAAIQEHLGRAVRGAASEGRPAMAAPQQRREGVAR